MLQNNASAFPADIAAFLAADARATMELEKVDALVSGGAGIAALRKALSHALAAHAHQKAAGLALISAYRDVCAELGAQVATMAALRQTIERQRLALEHFATAAPGDTQGSA